ncbi:MAG: methylated-DNA--[protein]-cysteine S-methyltransferase [Chloroflexota bacterium]
MTKKPPVVFPLYTGQLKHTPVGDLWLATSQTGLVAVSWAQNELKFQEYLTKRYKLPLEKNTGRLALIFDELSEYLNGQLKNFSIPIDWSVLRPFQQAVLRATYSIPYGEARSYGEIAVEIEHPGAARAVGRAEATNPMPLVIPCHRVIGADGKLRGYGGGQGLATKEWLLKMEGVLIA